MTRSLMLAGLCVAATALSLTSALADRTAPLYDHMEQRFTTTKPGAATGWKFDGALKPLPAGEQVPPQRVVDFILPRGTRIDPSAVPGCDASDDQITADGLVACPPASLLGSGEAALFLGAAGNLTARLYVFAAAPDVIAVFASESGTVLRVIRLTVRRRRVTAALPAIQLPGGYELAVTGIEIKFNRAGTSKHPFITTPPTCPKSGRWKFVYVPQYDAPYDVQRSTSSTRCRAAE
jgi:hypothetical protein